MTKQMVPGKERIQKIYWILVAITCALLVSVHPVMAETIFVLFGKRQLDATAALCMVLAMLPMFLLAMYPKKRATAGRIVVTWIVLNTLGFGFFAPNCRRAVYAVNHPSPAIERR